MTPHTSTHPPRSAEPKPKALASPITPESFLTSAPVSATAFGIPRPEFITVDMAKQLFGLSRSAVYSLLASHEIFGISLRKRGQKLGRRLISADSICEFFRRCAEGEQKGGASKT